MQTTLIEQPTTHHALALIDLNYFKQLNNTYGHITVDAVLQFVANNLKNVIGNQGAVALMAMSLLFFTKNSKVLNDYLPISR